MYGNRWFHLFPFVVDRCYQEVYNNDVIHFKEAFQMKRCSTILGALTLVILCFLLMPAEVKAETIVDSGECGSGVNWQLDSSGTLTISGSGYMDHYYIYVGGFEFKQFAPWSSLAASIESVVIEPGVQGIGTRAFEGCVNLTSITIPASVDQIGDEVFEDCSNLTNVYISDLAAWCSISFCDTDSNPMYHAENLYLNGKILSDLTIPDSVTGVGAFAFYSCENLTNVSIPETVSSIGERAFAACDNLISIKVNVDNANYTSDSQGVLYDKGKTTLIQAPGMITSCVIPNCVTSIGAYAFRSCAGLRSVTIPKSVTSIGGYAFNYCHGLRGVYISDLAAWCNIKFDTFSANPLNYANILYLNGSAITELVIPEGITTVNAYAFFNCKSLTKVVIPEGVTAIQSQAFYNCVNLTRVAIPITTKTIYAQAFAGCSQLEKVCFHGTDSEWSKISRYWGNTELTKATRISHDWVGGSCTTLQVCSICSVNGEHYGHTWIEGDDTDIKYCFHCGMEECEEYGHTWQAATCTTLQKCVVCGITEGDYGHKWTEATCTKAKTCSLCNKTEGTALGHKYFAVVTAPTCTKSGYTRYTCSACGDSFTGNTVAALGHSYKVVSTTDPTCAEPGYTTYTCSSCGDTYNQDTAPALGHTYDGNRDFICNTCGFDRLVKADNLRFLGSAGLSFREYIGMQILMQNDDAGYETVYALAVQQTPDGVVERVCNSIPYAGKYTVFEHPVVSWSMTEQITLVLYAEKDGLIYEGTKLDTNVKQLAMEKLAIYKGRNDTKSCGVVVDMLNYGAAVQVAYDYNSESLPNTDLGEYAAYGTTATPEFNTVNQITGTSSIKIYAENISLQDRVEFQFMLESAELKDRTVKVTLAGETVDVEYQEYGGYYTIIRIPVAAAHMRDVYTFAIYDANGNPVTSVYNISVEAYVKEQLGAERAPALIAMMKYGDAVSKI